MKGLPGKIAIVTGGAGAIGSAIVRRLIDERCRVVVTDLREDALAALAQTLPADDFVTIAADLTTEDGVRTVMDANLAAFGRVDLLVNAVGAIGRSAPITELTGDDLDAIYKVNVRSIFLMMKAVLLRLRAQGEGGAIVNLASIAAVRARAERALYGMSKRAIVALTASAALENGVHGIRINSVAPGPIDSEMYRTMVDAASAPVWSPSDRPIERLGQPGDVAGMVAFLLSDEAAYCTGGLYAVDGGSTA